MKNKNKTVWGTRFNKATSKIFEKIGASIDIDKRLFEEDIFGSIVHTQMLAKQKIINKKKGDKIINGLKKIRSEIRKNRFNFNNKYEDIHLNIEKRLFEIIGNDAGYMHIARSRNDQVITDFKLWIKKSSREIVENLDDLIKNFLQKAEKNIHTIMPGFTHLKNAQPISFAHYLLAYVEMFKRDKKRFTEMKNLDQSKEIANRKISEILSRFDRKIKDPRSFGENKKIVKIIREFLKINCSIDKLEKTLKSFVKKNKLSNIVFKDLSTIKNLSKINSKTIFSTNFGRDIEYYTGIVFEIYNSSKKEIARGGRYDGLLKNLGSKKNISAVGAAINLNNLQT